jgi:hypothetical protein
MPQQVDERALIVSLDGHATARMRDYRPYIEPGMRADFDAFCDRYDREGMTTVNPKSLANRIDPDLVQEWIATVLEPGRVEGRWDSAKRLHELDYQGISGEAIFPDFGLPFELHPPLVAAIVGYRRTPERIEAANRAYNRRLVGFCSVAPHRFAGLAAVSFADPDETVKEIRWAMPVTFHTAIPRGDEHKPLATAF